MDEQEMYNSVCKNEFSEIKGDLKEVLKTLKGNGGIGLCEDLRIQKMRIGTIEDDHKDVKQMTRNTVKWVAGIIGGSWLLAKSPEILEWIKKVL